MSQNGAPDVTSQDLANGTVRVVEPREAIDLNPGDVATGTITEDSVRTYEDGDDTYHYYEVTVQPDGSSMELNQSWSMNNGDIHENTALGAVLSRFDELTNLMNQKVSLSDIFVGKDVEFTVAEDDDGYTVIEDDSLKPASGDSDSGSSGGAESSSGSDGSSDSDGDGKEADVTAFVADYIGQPASDVKVEVAKHDGSLVPVFNDMVESGEIVDDDGNIAL